MILIDFPLFFIDFRGFSFIFICFHLFSVFLMFDVFCYFGAENGLTEAREAFKKTPGGRSSVLTEYEPVGSHGDPVQVIFVFKRQNFESAIS